MEFFKQKGPLTKDVCDTLLYVIAVQSLKPATLRDILTASQWNGMWFYSLAFLGKKTEGKETSMKILFVPYYFLFMNYNIFPGIVYLLRKKRGDGTWEKSRRK